MKWNRMNVNGNKWKRMKLIEKNEIRRKWKKAWKNKRKKLKKLKWSIKR